MEGASGRAPMGSTAGHGVSAAPWILLGCFLEGWAEPSRWQGGSGRPNLGGGVCNPIMWAGPLAKTNRQSYLNIYSPSQASSGVCTVEVN